MIKEMNIVIASSKEYSRYAQVLLVSLFDNNKLYDINVYYYYHESMEIELEQLNRLAQKYNNKIIPMYVDSQVFQSTGKSNTWNNATWFRWLCIEQLKGICDRALILGIDILIQKDISDFYFQNFEGYPMIISQDMGYLFGQSPVIEECSRYNKDINSYVNTDVCLLDLNQVSRVLSLEKMIDINNKNSLLCIDQDVLNFFYSEYIKIDHSFAYNYMAYVAEETMSEEEREKNLNQAFIVHFAGGDKPWKSFRGIEAELRWLTYAKKTEAYTEICNDALDSIIKVRRKTYENFLSVQSNYKLMDMWMERMERGKDICVQLKTKGYSKIGIYGGGRICYHLINQVVDQVEIAYIIDKNKNTNTYGIKNVKLEDITMLEDVDAIIVTVDYSYVDIKKEIQELTKCKVVSMRELIET